MKTKYYYIGREWPYKNVPPRILAEKYMEDSEAGVKSSLPVYKFFCFDGEPFIIQVIQNDKQPNESIDYFDVNWKLLNLKQSYPNNKVTMAKPEKLGEMLDITRKLSEDKKGFIRVDLYSINNDIFFF